MGSYYYLMSSFPSIDLKTAPAVSQEDFIQAAAAQLSEKETAALLEILSDDPNPGSVKGAAADYLRWDRAVRNALVRLRAGGGEAAADCRGGESLPSAAVTAAALMKIDSPLKAEQFWDSERWNYLENLKTGHCFDFDAAALYALQLRIAERNARFRPETGERNYAELYKTVIDHASKSGV